MALIETATVTLTGITRLPSSPSGNPRFTLHTNQGDYRTKVNTMCAYSVDPSMIGKRITLTLSAAGFVQGIDA